MSMDQLFKGLPRDLQWEILSEFVGTHSVRKGKLIQKIEFDDRHEMVQYLVFRIVKCNTLMYKNDYNTVTYAWLRDGSQLMFCVNPDNGEMGYLFRKKIYASEHQNLLAYWRSEYAPMNDTVVLPPFEKHYYPSYPDTDKKKRLRIR